MNNLSRMMAEATTPADWGLRYVRYLGSLLSAIDFGAVEKLVSLLEEARRRGRTVYFVGNGGSAATASHWANDLSLGTCVPGVSPIRAMSLTDNMAVLSALGNDRGYADIFVGQLEMLFQPGDVLIAISASGNSPNILRAIEFANAHGGTTVGLIGFDGGRMKSLCDICIHAETPKGEYGPVEDIHLILDHLVTSYLRARLQASVPAAPRSAGGGEN